MKRFLKITLYIALAVAGAFLLFLGIMWAKEYTPEQIEEMSVGGLSPDMVERDTLKIITWNIGYAGLNNDFDFFYDGGERVQDTEEHTIGNLRAIISFLEEHRDADFILLQEVDFDSKRTYHTNQYDSIRDALPEFYGWYAYNYVSSYVPIPLSEPIGEVKGGLVTLSKYVPLQVARFQYPSEFAFPVRLFNLKRCLLGMSFATPWGTLFVNNTHNTAYDTGGMRSQEFAFLRDFLADKPLSVTAGDWNSNPPAYHPSRAEIEDENFSPAHISEGDLGEGVHFLCDTTTPSARYLYEPYNPQTTTRTVIDFAALGARVKGLDVKTIDLGFSNSDHNPVVFTIEIVH